MKNENLSLNHKLENFLLRQRTTPQATTGQSPRALLLGRQVRTRLDLLRPGRVEGRQFRRNNTTIEAGQFVMVKNMRPGDMWIPGVLMRLLGPLTYLVDVGEGRAWK